MAQQTISVGTVANDLTGDPIRTAMQKVNANFTEIYAATSPAGANITSNNISASSKLSVGNTTPNNTLTVTGNAYISQNTLSLGTSTNAANGYTYLPNGFKMNWGWVSANNTTGTATFTAAYATNAYIVTATSNSATATFGAAVTTTNNTAASIRTANATSTNVFWTAIGY